MSEENKKTVEVYQKTAHLYLLTSAEHDRLDPVRAEEKSQILKSLIKKSFSSLPEHAKVFEIGCGEGKNAKFMESLGFEVTASDAADGFVEATKSKGIKTIKFDALEDNFPEKYSAVFAWRVFVHFTKEDALKIIQKVYDNLEEDGVFVFNAINRETTATDNEWVDFEGEYHLGVERYYSYFRKEELDNIIGQTKFQVQDFHTEGGKENNKWLVYVLKK